MGKRIWWLRKRYCVAVLGFDLLANIWLLRYGAFGTKVWIVEANAIDAGQSLSRERERERW